jgi:phosphonate transport system substrate-binding protein
MAYYLELLGFLERRLGVPIRAVDKNDYAEINFLLRDGTVDFAFVCSGPYVDGHDSFGLKLLAAPQAHGGTVYHSYIIVPSDSPARSLDDLRGKRFAFTDPLSNTGCLVPTYMLARRGSKPGSFFAETSYTRAHDRSIQAVAEGLVDGAAVDSLIWEYYTRLDPRLTERTRVIERSPPYAIPPVVVRPDLDPAVQKRIKDVLLAAHEDPEGAAILAKMQIDRFVDIDDAAFASIRDMKTWLERGADGRP